MSSEVDSRPQCFPAKLSLRGKFAVSSLGYFFAQLIAFQFPDSFGVMCVVWPAAGIALASLLLTDRRHWSALLACLFVSGMVAHFTANRPLAASVGFMVANICETFCCACLITRLCGDKVRFTRVKEVLALAVAVFGVNGATSLIGAATARFTIGAEFGSFYLTWFVADGLGLLLITPLILVTSLPWKKPAQIRWERWIEFSLLLLLGCSMAVTIFGIETKGSPINPRPFLLLVFVVWAAFRHGPVGTAILLCLFSIITAACTVEGWGSFPLGGENTHYRLLAVQVFLGVMGVTGLFLAAALSQLKEALHRLGESESRLRTFHDAAFEGIAITEDGIFLDVNTHLANLIGYDTTEIVGRRVSDFLPPEDRALVRQNQLAQVEGPYVSRLIHKNGTLITVETQSRHIFGPHQDLRLTALRDVTERQKTREALEETNIRLAAMFDGARDAIALTDPATGIIVEVNEEAGRLLNRPTSTIIGRHFSEFHPPDRVEEYAKVFARLVQEPHASYMEVEVFTSDQRRVPTELSASHIHLPNGKFLLQGIFRNIAERKRSEEQLRKLSRAIEQSPATIMITDCGGSIEYVNPKFTELTGYASGEVVGKNPRLLKSGRTPASVYRDLWQTICDGREWRGEMENRKKNGEYFWESASISPIRNAQGRITHFVAVKEDITAKRTAERRVREQAALLDQAHDAVLVMGLDRCITYCNASARRLNGAEANSLLGANGEELLFPDQRARCAMVCEETLAAGSWSGEIHYNTAAGKPRFVRSRWMLVRDFEGAKASFLITNTDVTEHRRMEMQLLRSQRMESLGTLASGVAHDLNNILAPIMMSVELLGPLARCAQDQDAEETLAMLRDSTQRGADIVRQLLIFGRGVEAHRAELQPRTLLREVSKIIKETFPKHITLDPMFPSDLWTVQADPTQIHQVILNLCVNARDAMPGGGKLTLAAENLVFDETYVAQNSEAGIGPYIVIEVSDTGSGIAPEILDRIFDPFFTTKPTGRGSGLGLSTVAGIVKSHGGFVRVQSRLGVGSQFKIYLPAATSDAVSKPAEPVASLPSGNNELILLVDDEESIRSVATRVLESRGYRVVTATNGAEGIVAFTKRQKEIGLVLTDMMMPVMDGPAMIRVLRQLAPRLRIIGMSGLTDRRQWINNPEFPLNAFLPKPFRANDLAINLRKVLDEKYGPDFAKDV